MYGCADIYVYVLLKILKILISIVLYFYREKNSVAHNYYSYSVFESDQILFRLFDITAKHILLKKFTE